MLRVRRSRILFVFVAIFLGLLYHLKSLGSDGNAFVSSANVATKLGHKFKSASAHVLKEKPDQRPIQEAVHHANENTQAQNPGASDLSLAPESSSPFKTHPVTSSASIHSPSGSPSPEADHTIIHWSHIQEHFPVPTQSLFLLPTSNPKRIPDIQDRFDGHREDGQDNEKLDAIKKTFLVSWNGYKDKAWARDELSPVSGKSRDTFCGWGATLVDSLDTLWIMGLKSEFEMSVKAIGAIDFTTTTRNEIPVFETVIRYLGGLLGAFDVSEGAYGVLLEKALELATVLMGAFDTPNRMPDLKYQWKPAFTSQAHRARANSVLAELGSLSLEFTRLAQLTKEHRYYDAITRISNELREWQNETDYPGLWPLKVDASGCKKAKQAASAFTISKDAQHKLDQQATSDEKLKQSTSLSQSASAATSQKGNLRRRDDGSSEEQSLHQQSLSKTNDPLRDDCEPQGLASPPYDSTREYSFGSRADSVYEYLPKQYLLLHGQDPQYLSMYESAIEAAKVHLLYRPMIPDEDRAILQLGILKRFRLDQEEVLDFRPEGAHLTCFAGGTFAIGSRIFDRPQDLDIARKLTDGCIWAYEATKTGIMPEGYLSIPCENQTECAWNQTLWEALNENREKKGGGKAKNSPAPKGRPSAAKDQESSLSKEAPVSTVDSNVSDDTEMSPDRRPSKRSREETTTRTFSVARRSLKAVSSHIFNTIGSRSALLHTSSNPKRGLDRVADPRDELSADTSDESTNMRWDDRDAGSNSDAKSEGNGLVGHGTRNLTSLHKEMDGDNAPWQNDQKHVSASASITGPSSAQPTTGATVTHDISKSHNEIVMYYPEVPRGMVKITGMKYLLRPEAIESVFIMYRVTGDEYWRKKGWKMFQAVEKHTRATYGASAINDVTTDRPEALDEMESFWLAETLKYFYLLFSRKDLISLDEYVLNTEAHPFKLSSVNDFEAPSSNGQTREGLI